MHGKFLAESGVFGPSGIKFFGFITGLSSTAYCLRGGTMSDAGHEGRVSARAAAMTIHEPTGSVRNCPVCCPRRATLWALSLAANEVCPRPGDHWEYNRLR